MASVRVALAEGVALMQHLPSEYEAAFHNPLSMDTGWGVDIFEGVYPRRWGSSLNWGKGNPPTEGDIGADGNTPTKT